jgi:hypothetical protein
MFGWLIFYSPISSAGKMFSLSFSMNPVSSWTKYASVFFFYIIIIIIIIIIVIIIIFIVTVVVVALVTFDVCSCGVYVLFLLLQYAFDNWLGLVGCLNDVPSSHVGLLLWSSQLSLRPFGSL